MANEKKLSQLLSPPGWLLLGAGIVVGLVEGLFFLAESGEKATAVGLTRFISISLGGWLATEAAIGIGRASISAFRVLDAWGARVTLKAEKHLEGIHNLLNEHTRSEILDEEKPPETKPTIPIYYRILSTLLRIGVLHSLFLGLFGCFVNGMAIALYEVGGLYVPTFFFVLLAIGLALTGSSLIIILADLIHSCWIVVKATRILNRLSTTEQFIIAMQDGKLVMPAPRDSMARAMIETPRLWRQLSG